MPYGAATRKLYDPVFRSKSARESLNGIKTLAEAIAASSSSATSDTPGLLPFAFTQTDVPASQSAVALLRQGFQLPIVMPYRGSLAALSLSASAAKTAGVCTLTAYINDVASALSVTWDTGTDQGYATLVQGSAGFEAGAEVDVRITTDSAFTPTTADIIATLFVALNPTTTL